MKRALPFAIVLAALVALSWWLAHDGRGDPPPDDPTASDAIPWAEIGPASMRAPATGRRLRGRIVDPFGAPITGCDVALLPASARPLDDDRAAPLSRMRTGVDGRFELSSATPTPVVLLARHPQFPPTVFAVSMPEGESIDVGDLRLTSELGLTVQVVREDDGAGIPGAEVALLPDLVPAELANDARRSAIGRSAHADRHGRATLHGVKPGSYRLRVSAAGFATFESEFVRHAGAPPATERVTLSSGLSLFGHVETADGVGVAGAEVTVATRPGMASTGTRTGDRGEFRLTGLLAGATGVRVAAPDHATVDLEVRLPHPRELVVTLPPPAGLAGRVIESGSGRPIPGATVLARPADGFAMVQGAGFVEPTTLSDDEGNFRIGGLPPGRFTIRASSDRHAPVESGPVDAAPEPDTSFTIELPPAVLVQGRVLGDDGRPVAGARIEAMDESYDGSAWAALIRSATREPARRSPAVSDAEGRFELPLGQRPGASFRLRATLPNHAVLLTAPVEVPVGLPGFEVRDLRLQRGVSVTGTARDGDGRPVPGATVCAEPVSDGSQPEPREGTRGIADSTGRFRLRPLSPGSYVLFYYVPSFERAAAAADRHASTRTAVTLTAGAELELDLAPR